MSELKTLKELSEIAGFPFEAHNSDLGNCKIIAITPNQKEFIGFTEDGAGDSFLSHFPIWTLVTPKKKLVEFLFTSESVKQYYTDWSESEDSARKWCGETDRNFITVLREVEI